MAHENVGLAVSTLMFAGAFVALGGLVMAITFAPGLVTDAVGVPVAVGAGALFVGVAAGLALYGDRLVAAFRRRATRP